MTEIPNTFLEMLDTVDIPTKEGMLELLVTSLKNDKLHKKQENLPDLVDYIPNFIADTEVLVPALEAEIESMLPDFHNVHKVQSQWLSNDKKPYIFGNSKYNACDISKYPSICKLMSMVNAHASYTGDLNCCLVNRYSSSGVSCRLHADDEDIISDESSIMTVSLGATRTIDFAVDCKSDITKSFTLESCSAFVMKPGCQQLLKHRLNRGEIGSGVRYSISFRRSVVPEC